MNTVRNDIISSMKVFASILFAMLAAGAVADGSAGYRQNSAHELPLDGVVTFSRPGDRYFFISALDGSGSWRIEREKEAFAYKVGTVVSVTNGETRATYTTRRVNHAWVAELKDAAADLPRQKDVTIDDLYSHPLTVPGAEDLWGRMVRCAGTVRDINRRQTFTQIQLGEGTRSFQASVSINIDTPLPEDLKLGAKVLIGGVMLYSPVDDQARHVMTDFTDVSVMPMDINDVEVLSKAPFWTAGRVWLLLAGIAVILALVSMKLKLTQREKQLEKLEFEAIRRERLKLSYELHDDFQQLLGSCEFQLEAAAEWLGRDNEKAKEGIGKVQHWLLYTQDLLRKRLWGMNEKLAKMEGPSEEEK